MEIISRTDSEQKLINQFYEFLDNPKTKQSTQKLTNAINIFFMLESSTVNPFIYNPECGNENCIGDCETKKCSSYYRIRGYKFNLNDNSTVDDFDSQFYTFLQLFHQYNHEDNFDEFLADLLESLEIPEHLCEYHDSPRFQKYLEKSFLEIFGHNLY